MPNQPRNIKDGKILRLPEVKELTGLSRSTIYARMGEGVFPQNFHLGGGHAVGWYEPEVLAWIAATRNRDTPARHHLKTSESNEDGLAPTHKRTTFDEELLEKRHAAIHQLLEQHAKRGQPVHYEQLMAESMLSAEINHDREIFEDIMAGISKASHEQHGALLGALAYEKKTGKPSEQFFKLAKQLGYVHSEASGFIEQQIRKMFEAYEDPQNKTKGRLTRIDTRRGSYLYRR